MNVILERLFNNLESQRTSLLQEISILSSQALNKQVSGKWSIAQIVSHLIASEQLAVGYLNKKILGIATAQKSGLAEELKMIALIISQRVPFKFKAPRVIVENTPAYESAEQLKTAWDKTRSELKSIVEKFQDDQINLKVFKHPRAGMLNIQQGLRFFGEHIIHHQPQIKKLLKRN